MTDANRGRYCPFWCEENIWHLCEGPRVAAAERVVVFVSNAEQRVVMWSQRAAPHPGAPVAWDYHVVLLALDDPAGWSVWDLDSALGAPVPALEWLEQSFRPLPHSARSFEPRFRLIPAADYRRRFASDRSHMLAPSTESAEYLRPPPPWPAIGSGLPSTLAEFVALDDAALDVAELRAWLAARQGPA